VRHTLLLADDSVTIQRVIELTFADENVDVVAVSDGEAAIACLDASPPPDIVLADIDMPGRNGYEVARYVKQSPRLAHIPVVLLTGAFEPVDQARAAEAGCDGILAKPFEPQLVIGRVKELLAKPRGAAWPPLDEPIAPPPAAPSPDLGEYFDRLDAAFASLSTAASQQSSAPSAAPAVPSEESPAAAEARRESHPSPPARSSLPSLADAFAALLAAEQRDPDASPAAAWPSAQHAAPVVTDEAIDEIVRRVLARLSDQVVRETVAAIVSPIAERLVREEIERIKSSIR
jgi:CheY-like chemotaxis protein